METNKAIDNSTKKSMIYIGIRLEFLREIAKDLLKGRQG